MAIADITEYLKLVPAVQHSPDGYLWASYDRGADALYINFKKPSHATDSELTADDVIVRYEGKAIVGFTVLHANQRTPAPTAALALVREKPAKKYGK